MHPVAGTCLCSGGMCRGKPVSLPEGWRWWSAACDVGVDRAQRTRPRCRRYRAGQSASSATLPQHAAGVPRLGRGRASTWTASSSHLCRPSNRSLLPLSRSQRLSSSRARAFSLSSS